VKINWTKGRFFKNPPQLTTLRTPQIPSKVEQQQRYTGARKEKKQQPGFDLF